MPTASADRNLLLGILAAQLDFITRDQLIAAMNSWLPDPSRPLGDLLRERGDLSTEELRHLRALVEVHLQRHGGDPRRSLAALSSIDRTLQQRLAELPDPEVRATVMQIGQDRSDTQSFGDGATGDSPAVPGPAAGRYRILKPHARGGLGEVFVAEDTELGRQVALKQIQNRHADDLASRGRFVLEAEVTGGLEHPGIVPVYGLGTYADGRPFYAMRFIQGDNLKDAIAKFHADAPRYDSLAFRELLGRFVDVCQAMAYAHSRGVLHRDLKPGNIMLGKYGETLVVDWGLAKTLGHCESNDVGDAKLKPQSGGESSATVAGRALGTPGYMPPEQAAGDWDRLGPTSDVYSLGATLYELLTGRVPFDARDLDVLLEDVRSGRFPAPRRINPAVPQPLEAVCLKAMARDPARRYGSTQELANEIERWLADEPVTAWREPFGSRLRRGVRKHARLAVGTAAALTVAAFALGALAWQRERARVAVANEQRETAKALQSAETRLVQVERGIDILASVFDGLDPRKEEKEGKALRVLLGERLDQATGQLTGESVGDPVAVAKLQLKLGKAQLNLGYAQKAIDLFTAARATLSRQLGADDPDTLQSMNDLASGLFEAGKFDAALPLLEDTLRLSKAKLGFDHPDTLATMNNLASGYHEAGKLDSSLPLLEETFQRRKAKLGADHADTLISMNNLAMGYRTAGKIDAALPLYEETLKRSQAKLGREHLDTLTCMSNLAMGYYAADKLDAALPLLEETLRLRRVKLGPDHPDTLASMNNLAECYRAAGKLNETLLLLEETLKLANGRLGPDHPYSMGVMNNLAGAYRDAGKFEAALPLLEEALKLRKGRLGSDHPLTLVSMNNLATVYLQARQPEKALPLLGDYLPRQKKRLAGQPQELAGIQASVADRLLKAGQPAAAEPILRECLQIRETLEPELWTTHNTKSMLGEALAGRKKFADAEPLLVAGYEGMKAREPKIPAGAKVRLKESVERLIRLYDATNRADDAAKWRKTLEKLKSTALPLANSGKP